MTEGVILNCFALITGISFFAVKKREGTITGEKMKESASENLNTPERALVELKKGNKRFMEGKSVNNNYREQIESTKDGQQPHSVILTCIDSRVPPEIIFNQGIGNIFAVRIAGNIADENVLGSLEFAVKVMGCKLIVVMGHSNCGAVKGAIDNAELGHLTQIVSVIRQSISGDKSDPEEMANETARKNVIATIEYIMENSGLLSGLVEKGEIKIAGAFYDVSTGKVEFLV